MMKSLMLTIWLSLLINHVVFSQKDSLKIEICSDTTTIKELITCVENQTNYTFFYNNSIVSSSAKIVVGDSILTLRKLLNNYFSNDTLSFEVIKNHIIIKYQKRSEKQSGIFVNGRVHDENFNPINGALIVSDKKRTLSNLNGYFNLEVESDTSQLTVTHLAYQPRIILLNGARFLNIECRNRVNFLNEVFVTALGIDRNEKSLGFSADKLDKSELNKSSQSDFVTRLKGKVSGMQIVTSSGQLDASSYMVIRGNRSITGNNMPMVIVDGIPIDNRVTSQSVSEVDWGNPVSDINPEDIDNITILKGGNASAMYGSRAANGVILITTKNASDNSRFIVELNNTLTMMNALIYPDYQDDYGQGYRREFRYEYGDGKGGINDLVDESWGPKLDGRLIPQFNSPVNSNGEREAIPWISRPDNFRKFLKTGIMNQSNLAISASSDQGKLRVSLGRTFSNGILQNTSITKHSFNINGEATYFKKYKISGNFIYSDLSNKNRPNNGYSGNNPIHMFRWSGRQIDIGALREYENEDGTQFNWNHGIWNNPYWMLYKNINPQSRKRYTGNISFIYTISSQAYLQFITGTDLYFENREELRAKNRYHSKNGIVELERGSYTVEQRISRNDLSRLMFSYNLTKNRWRIDFKAGASLNTGLFTHTRSIAEELVLPETYNLGNSAYEPKVRKIETNKYKFGIWGMSTLSYSDYVFLDFTIRNDWTSTLPKNNNSYYYPSASLSYILSDVINMNPKYVNLIKLRFGTSITGNDIDEYRLKMRYHEQPYFNNHKNYKISTEVNNNDLKPEMTSSIEFGADMILLKNRLGFNLSLYKENSYNQIMDVKIPYSSGYKNRVINTGEIENKGIELTVKSTNIKRDNFKWNTKLNWSQNLSNVRKLYGDMKTLVIYNYSMMNVGVTVGEPYGVIYGVGYERDRDGQIIVGEDGIPLRNENVKLGTITPDWLAGVTNSFAYKGFNLDLNIDIKKGGRIFSGTNEGGAYTGVLGLTNKLNVNGVSTRETLENGGGVLVDGVNERGEKNRVFVDAETYFHRMGNFHEAYTYDASYVKLRNVALSYSFPEKLVKKLGLSVLKFTIIGNNLWIIDKNVPNIDPESSLGGMTENQGIQSATIPSTRNISFRIDIKI